MPKLSVNSTIYPYGLSLRERRPAELEVEITNKDSADKLLSLSILLPDAVAFDKSGLNKGVQKRLDSVNAGETKVFKYPVFITSKADPGLFSGRLVVSEHASGYDYVKTSYSKEVAFRIID